MNKVKRGYESSEEIITVENEDQQWYNEPDFENEISEEIAYIDEDIDDQDDYRNKRLVPEPHHQHRHIRPGFVSSVPVPVYNVPSYSAPAQPSYSSPPYSAPSYSKPSYHVQSAPSYSKPSYAPAFSGYQTYTRVGNDVPAVSASTGNMNSIPVPPAPQIALIQSFLNVNQGSAPASMPDEASIPEIIPSPVDDTEDFEGKQLFPTPEDAQTERRILREEAEQKNFERQDEKRYH